MSLSLKRIVSILALVSIFLSLPIFANAENDYETEIPTRYTTISTTYSNISKSGVTVTCKASLTAQYSTSLKIVYRCPFR